MNAYDFDGCIYEGDSTLDFYFFCVKRQPKLLRFLGRQIGGFLLIAFGFMNKTQYKQRFFSFLQGLDNVDDTVRAFWQTHIQKISKWYLAQKSEQDLVVSASPEFLLRPCCDQIGVHRLVASRVDPATGRFTGENCYGAEKPARLKSQLGVEQVGAFYSDSLSDLPMAQIAGQSYLVQNGRILPWTEYRPNVWQKIKRHAFSFEFFRFLVVGCVNTLNGVVFSYLFSKLLPAQVAFWCGYLASLTISYLLNSVFTFHESMSFRKMLKFFVSYIPNFLIQNIVVFLVNGVFGLPELYAYILAAAIGIPVTFLLLKIFAFRKKIK
ncbi:MAG: HAD-IB family phosphatase [Christensenella sp.]